TWRARFAPDHVGIRGVANSPCDGLVESRAYSVETFPGALAGEELLVAFINVIGEQGRRVRIRARHNYGRHIGNICRQPRRDQMRYGGSCRNEHLATHVSALLL